MGKSFYDLFGYKKVIIGMIHLSGKNKTEKLERAIEEVTIYENLGLDGAIVEDYHGEIDDVKNTLEALSRRQCEIQIGVNVLRDPYLAFEFADKYGASFIQFDTIQASAGNENNPKRFNDELYMSLGKKYPNICVFGGVRFKYVPPTGKTLEEDIINGMSKCEAIVTTGSGTGIETPLEKLKDFRKIMGNDFPLIIGAGFNIENAAEQIEIVNGAIIGSYFKSENTYAPVDGKLVRKIVDEVKHQL